MWANAWPWLRQRLWPKQTTWYCWIKGLGAVVTCTRELQSLGTNQIILYKNILNFLQPYLLFEFELPIHFSLLKLTKLWVWSHVKIASPNSPLFPGATSTSGPSSMSPTRPSIEPPKKGWKTQRTTNVNIVLVEGKELLAMDLEGTSDPYCKFR